ncbi:hypothetical protein GCM10007982_02900 [Helicobacter pylori]|nr:hypothetical protein GCM10007982_02900 [Helicobacter pylori]
MRPVGNALELKLCKIPILGTQSENQTLPTGNIILGIPIVFSSWDECYQFMVSYPHTFVASVGSVQSDAFGDMMRETCRECVGAQTL